MKQRHLAQAVVGVALVALHANAVASVQIFIDPQFGSTGDTGSTAVLTFEFSKHGNEDLLTVVIENTTSPKIGSKLTAVGFELPDFLVDPPSLGKNLEGGYFDTLTYDDSVSPGWLDAPDGFDLVLTSDGNLLGGSPNGAPTAGSRTSVVLNLGDTGMSPADLELAFQNFYRDFTGPFALGRFQAVGGGGEGSDKVGGSSIPEPATIALLAAGAAMLLHRTRRRLHA